MLPGKVGDLAPWVGRRVGRWMGWVDAGALAPWVGRWVGWVDGSWKGWGSRPPGSSTTEILPLLEHPRHNRHESPQAALVDHSRRRRPFVLAHRAAVGGPRTAVDKGDVIQHGRTRERWLPGGGAAQTALSQRSYGAQYTHERAKCFCNPAHRSSQTVSDNGLCATLLVRRSHPGQSVRHEIPCVMKPLKANHKRVDLASLLEEGT